MCTAGYFIDYDNVKYTYILIIKLLFTEIRHIHTYIHTYGGGAQSRSNYLLYIYEVPRGIDVQIPKKSEAVTRI